MTLGWGFLFLFLETVSNYVAQAILKFMILLPQPPSVGIIGMRHTPSYLGKGFLI
jgi:hypothetical protein